MPTGVYKRPSLTELIIRKTEFMSNGCWETKRHAHRPEVYLNGKKVTLYRLMAHLKFGMPLDSPLDVCHHCDNPRCFRPIHLFVGTRQDNMHDAVRKRRFPAHSSTYIKPKEQ